MRAEYAEQYYVFRIPYVRRVSILLDYNLLLIASCPRLCAGELLLPNSAEMS